MIVLGRLISNMIDAVKEIHCLILSGNTLGVDASRVISNSLSRQPTLKEAIFADMFTGRLKTEIPNVLVSFQFFLCFLDFFLKSKLF